MLCADIFACVCVRSVHNNAQREQRKKICAWLHPMWTYMWTPTLCKEPVYSNMTTAFSSVQEN